jgi:hypothetical protein
VGFIAALKSAGKFIAKLVGFAKSDGLTDELVTMLLEQYVPQAAVLYSGDSAARREWVVAEAMKALGKTGKAPSETVVRIALELAVRAFKQAQTPDQA